MMRIRTSGYQPNKGPFMARDFIGTRTMRNYEHVYSWECDGRVEKVNSTFPVKTQSMARSKINSQHKDMIRKQDKFTVKDV